MAKKSKLLAALDAHKGWDYQVEKQKELLKRAKRKKAKETPLLLEGSSQTANELQDNSKLDNGSDGWEIDGSEDESVANDMSNMNVTSHKGGKNELAEPSSDPGNVIILDQQSDGDEGGNGDGDIDSDPNEIPLSDLEDFSGDEEGVIIPHQRLTINNTSALIKATSYIAVPLSDVPFSEHQSVISAVQISIPDINDDLNRELTFYKQCLDAVNEGRSLLKREGVPFTRPTDYFAEMVKTDEHMGKIKQKMTDEAANKRAAAEARRQRDLKKFGKQVQVAKIQERDKSKRETLEKINLLKRKRRNTDNVNTQEEDLFDVALEDTNKLDQLRSITKGRSGAQLQNKRQKKNAKFGFGGKKRFSKSSDALSSGDMKGFSSKKMKGHKTSAPRLGKSRRAKHS